MGRRKLNPPTSIFSHAARAIADRAAAAVRGSNIGRIAKEVERFSKQRTRLSRTQSRSLQSKLMGLTANSVLMGLRSSEIGRAVESYTDMAEKYAAGDVAGQIMESLIDTGVSSLGPLGKVLGWLIDQPRPSSMASGPIKREIEGMIGALQAMGFSILTPSAKTGGASKQEIEDMKSILEQSGYTVTPAEGGGQPTVEVGKPKVAMTAKTGGAKITIRGDGTVTIRSGGGRGYNVPPDDPLVTGEMIQVNSSNVHSIGYDISDEPLGTLLVRYLATLPDGSRGGPGPLYKYYNVPINVFQAFRRSGSPGGFVWDKLRVRGTVSGHQFDYSLADVGPSGYIPRKARVEPDGTGNFQEVFMPRTWKVGGKTITSPLPREVLGKIEQAYEGRSRARGPRDRSRGNRSRTR